MFEVVKEFLMLFGFSFLEVFILLFFCKIVGKFNKISNISIILFSILVMFLHDISFPFIRQIILFSLMITYIKIKEKNILKDVVKIFIMSTIYLLVFEVLGSIVYQCLFKIDFSKISEDIRLIYLIPIRALQILTLYKIRRNNMGMIWFGEVEETEEVVEEKETEE